MDNWYRLNSDHTFTKEEEGVLQCAKERRVALTSVTDDTSVSTVFLSLDHNHANNGPPILFETCVFSDRFDDDMMVRYRTWDEAFKGHWKVVKKVKERLRIQVKPSTPKKTTLKLR